MLLYSLHRESISTVKPFFKSIDGFLLRESEIPRFSKGTYWPSLASAKVDGKVFGACLRASWLHVHGAPDGVPLRPAELHTIYSAESGKEWERYFIQKAKEVGIWVADDVEIFVPEYNLSGKIDAIYRDEETGELYIAEHKSHYGYYAKKQIEGTRTIEGRPKHSHLMQTALYLWLFKKNGVLDTARLLYHARDDNKHAEFVIELVEEDGKQHIVVTNPISKYKWTPPYTVDDILNRYLELDRHVKDETMPAPDYELYYSDEKAEALFKAGELSKSQWTKHQKGERAGDWRCKYCKYVEVCYPKDPATVDY